ncbi:MULTISPECIES: isochorismate synthase [Vagococcus]|uniref:isochorismate synthase n=1 Tax=Vagococcus fluvialis bH819 TaxID=1255619 RepID=A0A1X6WNA8_9ENTE|nr:MULTISPECIES: isochorismate synthase [Vagococcus]SLM85755.1 Menaquinone-specific isochorismate synthase [Vagococcus fluvialis bH819]HCM90177.1 isochorismate synthase [Vagococcus sp.]
MKKELINFELPEKLKNEIITEPTLISWVFNINADPLISDYERTSTHYAEHFYFENATDNSGIYGVGSLPAVFTRIITNASVEMTGPIEMISGLFDETTDSSEIWGELSQTVTYLPKIIRTEKQNQQWVTINMLVNSTEDLFVQWQEEIKNLYLFRQLERPSTKKINKILIKEELKIEDWLQEVELSVAHLKSSETLNKIVLARQLKIMTEKSINPVDVLKRLRAEQPDTYRFVVAKNQSYFIGATPERLLQATTTDYSTVCVAGSIKRGKTLKEDQQLGDGLLSDQKNVIEHHYVVRWLQEEMTKLTTSLDKKIPVSLLKNRDIQHLFLPIKGERKKEVTFSEGIAALHPSPALGGLPKKEAINWIKNHEYYPRGLYGGPLGWRNILEDTGEVVVGIRSAYICDNQAILYAGCGIVEDSIATLEREETKVKFQPMLRALGGQINE